MAILRAHDVGQLTDVELQEQMGKLRMELSSTTERSVRWCYRKPRDIRELRRTIARLMTEKNRRSRASSPART